MSAAGQSSGDATAAIIRKIQALRARAACAGSTEHEAAMAAKKAQELLDRHNLTLSETDVRADGVESRDWDSGKAKKPVAMYAARGIEKACNVTIWRNGGIITCLGAPADVEVALYYLDLTDNAVWSCWREFQRSPQYSLSRFTGRARSTGSSFRKGVAMRLCERFEAMGESERHSTEAGTGLVVVKDAMQAEWLAKHDMKFRSDRPPTAGYGFSQGFAAGADVVISSGIGSSRAIRPELAA